MGELPKLALSLCARKRDAMKYCPEGRGLEKLCGLSIDGTKVGILMVGDHVRLMNTRYVHYTASAKQ